MLRIFSFFIAMLLATLTFAETVRLAWNPQLMREDGTRMTLSEVSYYVLSVDGGQEEIIKADNVVKDLTAGLHGYTIYVCDINGLCSAKTVKKFAVKPRPNKPKYPSVRAL